MGPEYARNGPRQNDYRLTHDAMSAVSVSAVADVGDLDGLSLVIDGVPDSVLSASCPPMAFEGFPQRRSYAVRVLGEWPVDELHAGGGHGLGKVAVE